MYIFMLLSLFILLVLLLLLRIDSTMNKNSMSSTMNLEGVVQTVLDGGARSEVPCMGGCVSIHLYVCMCVCMYL